MQFQTAIANKPPHHRRTPVALGNVLRVLQPFIRGLTRASFWCGGKLLPYAIGVLLIAGISFGLSFTSLSVLQSFRMIFGSVFLLLLPGYVWSFVFWKRQEIDFIERFALSLALSLALVPLIVYALNRIGVRITMWNSIVEISGLILVGIVLLLILQRYTINKSAT